MKKGKLSASDRARSRLLDNWQRAPEYGEPVGCVATSYTFDAAFFEEQCLSRFVGMDSEPGDDPRGYVIEREEKLGPVFATVIVDQLHVPTHRSLRWNVLAARVANGGILHAKLSLLVWEHCIRVVIATANLSDAGYRRNLEKAGCLDFTADGDLPLSLLREVLMFVEETRRVAPGYDQPEGPQDSLRRFLDGVRTQIASWASTDWARGKPKASLIFTGPGRPHLFAQLGALWPFAPATQAFVVSPFFDEGNRATTTAKALEAILIQRGDQEVTFCVEGRPMPDGSVQLDMPASLRQSTRKNTTYRHARIQAPDGEEPRPLHAKSLWIERDEQVIYCLGSSNFTQAGTGARIDAGPINIELNLAYTLSTSDDFAAVCQRTYPHYEDVDVENEVVSFVEIGSQTAESDGLAVLPFCFKTATLRPLDKDRVSIELEIEGTTPSDFVVALPGGKAIIDAATWARAGSPRISSIESTSIMSFLEVTWTAPEEAASRAVWAINVADSSLLPPPVELRELSLDALLELLTSARPAHETISRLLKMREASQATLDGIETDPHKKVDTRHHLLKRMRRAAIAMEELRVRLERPSFSRESLQARLHGPIGPVSLAEKLVAEEQSGAAFMIAELATTVASARLEPRGELTMPVATALVAEVVRSLAKLARERPAPANLAAYINASFEELHV